MSAASSARARARVAAAVAHAARGGACHRMSKQRTLVRTGLSAAAALTAASALRGRGLCGLVISVTVGETAASFAATLGALYAARAGSDTFRRWLSIACRSFAACFRQRAAAACSGAARRRAIIPVRARRCHKREVWALRKEALRARRTLKQQRAEHMSFTTQARAEMCSLTNLSKALVDRGAAAVAHVETCVFHLSPLHDAASSSMLAPGTPDSRHEFGNGHSRTIPSFGPDGGAMMNEGTPISSTPSTPASRRVARG
mmetsp:Transcript_63324/g.182172  ORF Transcript_63324/g.182172 Transcript_63324/m.182172 type:complete len:259 (-) Transcript_63324:30-806(-)